MARDLRAEIVAIEAEIAQLADRFGEAAREALQDALGRGLERLVASRGEWFAGLDAETAASLRRSTDQAVASSAAATAERLRDPDLWRSPMTAPGRREPRESGWETELPEWLVSFLRRFTRGEEEEPGPEALDDPSNRIWLQLLNAADPLDPILTEFGLAPVAIPDPGGGALRPPAADPGRARPWGRPSTAVGWLPRPLPAVPETAADGYGGARGAVPGPVAEAAPP